VVLLLVRQRDPVNGAAGKHTTIVDGKRLLWRTERLWRLAAGLQPFDVDIESITELDMNCWFIERSPTLRAVAQHAERIARADLDQPIILNADGSLMDGGHRICRALLEGRSRIRAVRFAMMPEPDEILDID
jgi:hypothetical protein